MLYLFQLGRQPEISEAELQSVFVFFGLEYTVVAKNNANLFVEIRQSVDAVTLMNRLGGTIKIARCVGTGKTPEEIATIIEDLQLEGKIQFSLSGNNAKSLALETKKILKENGRSVRYIEAKNTATILHNSLVQKSGDFTLTKEGMFVTEAIQPIEDWGERDFGRPGRDSRSGMLPPKLARIMINLAGANTTLNTNIREKKILDPFCGSGTVLMESILLGYTHIFGSDISDRAIQDTKINTEWILENGKKEKPATLKIVQSDVRRIADKIQSDTIDSIATEPFLGKPLKGTETRDSLEKQAHELKSLYIEAFKAFAKVMKKGGSLVFLIPRFKCKQEWIRIHCSEEIQKLGFEISPLSPTTPFLIYSRPDQFVGREIWRFVKH